jgi:hypothetical protein
MSTIDLLSKLPRAECERRLRRTVSSPWSLASQSGVVGTVNGDAFRIRKMIYYRNSFQIYLHGQLSDAPSGGTRVRCEFRELNLRPVLIAAVVVVLIALAGMIALAALHGSQFRQVPLIVLIAPLGVLPLLAAAGVLAVNIGRWAARGEQQYLVDFLCRTLEANKVG